MSAARFDESVPREPQQPARRAFAAAVVLAGALSCAPVLADDVQATRYQILTLQSADLYLPAFVLLDQATRSELQARLGQRAEFHVEALDILRNPREQSEPEMVAFLRNKYQGVKIDVVVATETAALEFADRHGGELWPGAPTVFELVPVEDLPGRRLGPRTRAIQKYERREGGRMKAWAQCHRCYLFC